MREPCRTQADFYVATNGDDFNPGSEDKPFVTLARARDAVRDLKKWKTRGDVTVYFRGGVYPIRETVLFVLEDSGSQDQVITYAAFPGEVPVFSAGVRIAGWKELKNPPSALPKEAHGKVWVAEIPEAKGGKWRFHVLFDGSRSLSSRQLLPRARAKGFRPLGEVPYERGEWWQGELTSPEERKVIRFPKGVLRNWPNLDDVELRFYPDGYVMNMLGLESVDEDANVAWTTVQATYPIWAWPAYMEQEWKGPYDDGEPLSEGPPSVWVENVLEGLDEPGEWVLDTHEGKLYLWPFDETPGEGILAPRLRELIRVEGEVDFLGPTDIPVRHLVFRGLTFAHGDRDTWTKEDAAIQHDWEMVDKPTALVRFRATEHCVVDECRFTNTGGTGLRLDLHSQYNWGQRSLFEYLGQVGIFICGYGPGTKDVSFRNQVVNNRIHHCGEIFHHGHAIILWQSGENRVAHNLIHDVPRKAVSVSGVRRGFFNPDRVSRDTRECARSIRWHEVPDPGLLSSLDDVVAFLHCRNNVVEYNEACRTLGWGQDGAAINMTGMAEGNIIRRNYVHHIENPGPDAAIRLDTSGEGTLIAENIIFKCGTIGIVVNDEKNHVENNIVVDVQGVALLYRHGRGDSRILRNVVYQTNHQAPYFSSLRPEALATLRVDFNLYYCANDPAASAQFLRESQEIGLDPHSISADPLFVDAKNGDLHLRGESPVLRVGFKQMDMSKIGLRGNFPDRYR